MRIDLSCRECGENRFGLSHAAADDSIVACEDCGHVIGTLGQLKEQVAQSVLLSANGKSRPTRR